MKRSKLFLGIAAVCTAVLATACSSGSNSAGTSAATSAETSAATTASQAATSAGSTAASGDAPSSSGDSSSPAATGESDTPDPNLLKGKTVWYAASTKGGVTFMDRLIGGGGTPINDVTEAASRDLIHKLFK